MGDAGDSPAPVGDPPTGTSLSHVAQRAFSLPSTVVCIPFGGSPDGTGGSPVLPGNYFTTAKVPLAYATLNKPSLVPELPFVQLTPYSTPPSIISPWC